MNAFFLYLLIISSSALAEVVILSEQRIDINKDGKKDSIAWVASSKESKRPSRLVIRVPGKILLDLSGNFCAPGEKASDCTPLKVYKRLTPKKEPLIVFETGSSTYIYRWKNHSFRPYSASSMTKEQRHEINYPSGVALVSSMKKTETCPLANSRAHEDISTFTLFEIRDEVECPPARKTIP